jgi:hypothetical protein
VGGGVGVRVCTCVSKDGQECDYRMCAHSKQEEQPAPWTTDTRGCQPTDDALQGGVDKSTHICRFVCPLLPTLHPQFKSPEQNKGFHHIRGNVVGQKGRNYMHVYLFYPMGRALHSPVMPASPVCARRRIKCSEAFKITNGCKATFTEVDAVVDSSAGAPSTSDVWSIVVCSGWEGEIGERRAPDCERAKR